DEADGVFAQTLGREFLLDIGGEAPFVILGDLLLELAVLDGLVHADCAPAEAGAQTLACPGWTPAFAGELSCCSETAPSAPRTALPTTPMCGLTLQCASSAH